MKNKTFRLFISVFFLTLLGLSNCKNKDLVIDSFKIERERVVPTADSVSITGSYSFVGSVKGIKLNIGEKESLIDASIYEMQHDGTDFSIIVGGLKPSTRYYYCYSVDFGTDDTYLTDTKSFVTLDAVTETPTVKTLEVLAIDSTTFRVKCEVVSDGGQEVTERGICWNTYGDPTMDDETMQYANGGLGQYTLRMEDLAMSTTHYVRAYAKNANGISLGEVLEFRTGSETMLPQVSTVEVSDVTYNTATCLCNVNSNGGLELSERGVCWGLEIEPTINVHHTVAEGIETGNFTVTIEGLVPNTTYHVRAYATNEKGTNYGEDLTFTTTEGLPLVTTAGVTDITATSATCGGNVTDEGASPVTERGICWNTNHNPTTSDSYATSGAGIGSYATNMTNLTPNATYYVRAYAKNNQGTAYGSEVEFTATEGLPVVQTLDIFDITTTTAKAQGKVTDQGGGPVSERGVCWNTEPSPTIDNNHDSNGTGTGEYTVNLTRLTPGTKYYVRAYAKNNQGIAYGEQKDFTTQATIPSVVIVSINGTTVNINVTNDGGATVTECGICWSTNHNPTTADHHTSVGSGTGSYIVELTDLEPGTTYYVRAYATNSIGSAYSSDELSLTTTANPPTVTTGEVSNITQTSAQGSGNVTDDGGATVTERGLCWSTTHNPTLLGNHANDGTGGLGNFTVNMTGLTTNTRYYVRAYAKNSAGVQYGNEVSFTTSQDVSAPTVTTAQVTNIQQNSATGGGNVTSDGGAPVIERGICWSTNHNPTTSGSHISNGTGTGSFTCIMNGLSAGTTYYVRAYAINSQGTSYGSEVSFTTQQIPSYTISVSANSTSGGTVTGGGTYQQGQNCTVSATTNTGYTFTNWTENGNVVSTEACYTFVVNADRNLEAYFEPYTYIIIATAAPTDGGTINGSSNFNQTYTYGETCTLTASPNEGFTFTNWTENGYAVSNDAIYSFTVNADHNLVANYNANPSWPNGVLPGYFSVSATQQVRFSQGNLQYKASTNAWRFAPTQYNYIGSGNTNISQTYNGWIDLFGWGTSGYNHGANCYHPWSTNTHHYDYYVYNCETCNLYDQTGQADWGYNAISNGGAQTNQWRTLTKDEWNYVFNTRSTTSGIRYAKAALNDVNGVIVNGVILLPDNWSSGIYSLNNTNDNEANYNSNPLTISQWEILEQGGAVFLPAAGRRRGTTMNDTGSGGYWSATYKTDYGVYRLYFNNEDLDAENDYYRDNGFSVRLVRPVP